MSSTPAGYQLQFNDDVPYYLKPKPLYGNIVDVSLTTSKCTVVTWPPPQRSRKGHKIKTYTFMLNELPHTQASGMLKNALVVWVNKARAAEFEEDESQDQPQKKQQGSPSKSKYSHSRNASRASNPSSPPRSAASAKSQLSAKEQKKLLIGPRVTFLDEEEVMAPPPLPPKDSRHQLALIQSPSRLSPSSSPVTRKHHHHRRRSSDLAFEGHAVDIGLVWWEAEMHGQCV
ncbi:hypothetical protein P389DRAFT_203188 [Cystobasidium minutum MCA 4210]|uniref:uncharacterized protein n=1 Tax=Cystobasidium minutum MCA 4210 TaxID=1397322 RepID=UPI0034CE3899|eukprot:jgi/Rhomi1/203188/MIX4017_327_87